MQMNIMLKIKNVSDNGAWENLTFEQPEAGFKAMLVNIKLQVYAGKKIQLAFVYKNAKTDSAPKWEIQNVKNWCNTRCARWNRG